MKISIVIVDDLQDMMRGPQTILENMDTVELGGETITWDVHAIVAEQETNGIVDVQKLANQISRYQPGVAIVDMRLQGDEPDDLSGVDLSLRIRALCPDCCIILVSAYFADTPQKKFFEHLEMFRCLISRGGGLSPKMFAKELAEKVQEAILTHASALNYRRLRFADCVNNRRLEMWGLVHNPNVEDPTAMARLSVEMKLPIPYLTANSVVVQLIEVGVCGTDRRSLGLLPSPEYSLIDFHEAFGRVVWTGEAVRSLRIGDYVVPMVRRCETWDRPADGAAIQASSFGFRRCYDATHRSCYMAADQCPVGEFQSEQNGTRRGYKSRGTGKCHGFGSQYFVDTEEWLVRVDLPSDEAVRKRMMKRYVLTEPMSIVWKAHREILNHYRIREYDDRVLVIGLGPIGILAATVMSKLHPGLNFTAVDLAPETNERVRLLMRHLPEFKFIQAKMDNTVPSGLNPRSYNVIIEATDQPDQILKYAPSLLAPGGILVLIGISEEGSRAEIGGEAITDLVKRGNILIGSINSSRSDFEDSVAFLERMLGDEMSILNDVDDEGDLKGMVTRIAIDNQLPEKIAKIGRTKPYDRDEIKVVLSAGV